MKWYLITADNKYYRFKEELCGASGNNKNRDACSVIKHTTDKTNSTNVKIEIGDTST